MVTDELYMVPDLANLRIAHDSVEHSLDVGPVAAFQKARNPELPARSWRVLTIVPRKDRQPPRLVPDTADQLFLEDAVPDPTHQSSEGIRPRLLDRIGRWPSAVVYASDTRQKRFYPSPWPMVIPLHCQHDNHV